jgi:aryl-alcohol dehydrogenase-like predicted oxidoreductase
VTFTFGVRQVRRLGFGAMQLPGPGVFGPPRDRATAVAVLRRAVEAGVNHFDTAQYYGPDVANELLREVLHPYPPQVAIVSKVGAFRDATGGWGPAQRPEELRAGVLANLRALDIEQLHAVNLRLFQLGHGPLFDDQLAEMVAMRDEGLIAGIGLSNISLEQLSYASARTPIVCVQNAYNVLDQSATAVLRECERQGIAFVPFFPLGSARGSVRDHPVVAATAQRLGITSAQTVLAWTLAVSPNTLLIPGTSSLAHLDENLAAAVVDLDDDAYAALTALGVQHN